MAQLYKRKLTAILSADVAGYSRLMGRDEAQTVQTLTAYRNIMAELVKQHRGRVIDSPGDNVLAEFVSVVDAMQCAVAAQNEFKARNAELAEDRRMQFRMGVNLGDVIEEEGRIYGDGVNITARLESLADPGGICISKTAFDHIETKLPFGYEYLGELTVKNIDKPVGAYKVLMQTRVTGEKGKTKPKRRAADRYKNIVAGALIVVVIIVGGLIWYLPSRQTKIEPAALDKMVFALPERPSIAVLPFANMSGDPNEEYFSDGLTEQIITTLSRYPRLFVIARQSSFSYKGRPVKVQQVAEELGVQFILEGGVQKSGDKVRITAQLIDAITGRHVWSERYDRKIDDIFVLQDEITIHVMNGMSAELIEGDQARHWTRKGVSNLKALEKHYQAQGLFCRHTREDYAKARPIFEEAIALDPNFVWPYVYLGYLHNHSVQWGWSESPSESLQTAFDLAQRAHALDETHDGPHSLLAGIYLTKREYGKALSEAERAVALNPNASDAYTTLSHVSGSLGRWDESVSYGEKSLRLSPFPGAAPLTVLGYAYLMTENYDQAIVNFKKALKVSPNYLPGHALLAACYGSAGRDASGAVREVLRLAPNFNIESFLMKTQLTNETDRERLSAALRKAGFPDKPPLSLPGKPSIAVLPFTNMSDDPKQEYFSDGLTEEIITALSKTPKLFVIARNSSFVFKGKAVNVKQVGRELGVQYVLEGSVRSSGDQLRITAQLIDAISGKHLWAERYNRKMEDLFAIQDEVTMKILTSLQVELTEGESARSFDRGTDSLEAYLKTIEARELAAAMNKDDNALARRKFEEAIELDSKFARAYAGLSFVNSLDFLFGVNPQESLRKAHEYAQKALDLDEDQLFAHGALEFVYTWRRQHDMAIASGERAVQVAPGCADAYFYLGRALSFAGRYQESISQLEKAIRMNPFPPGIYYMHLGMSQLSLRQYEQAVATLKKALALNPKNIAVRRMLTITYVEMGKLEDAKVQAEEILKIDPKFTSKGFEKILPFKDSELTRRYLDGMRMAGLERDI
jgi:adenylate cyclase